MSSRSLSEFQSKSPRNSDNAVKVLMRTILEEIKTATKRPEKPSKSFVCYVDLKRIWSDQSRIRILLEPDRLPQHQINFIQEHMKMILSTLVEVGAAECLANFRSRLFDTDSGDALFTDKGIPFEMDQLAFLESEPALQQHFYECQYRFKPVVIEIETGKRTPVKKTQMFRLPFEYREKDIGSGGFGKVDRVGISPRYFKGEGGSDWGTVYEVACKKIKVPAYFEKEVDNLEILKESLVRHHRIMLHLTTIEHGPNRYILLPYAQYGDLELFFHCGIGPNGKPKYDFDKNFNGVRDLDVTRPLLHQCWSLAHALKWLHEGIPVEKTSTTVFCAHMDLKPANILIQHDPESPVGKWMISDFGISVVREMANEQDSKFVSIGDYYSKFTMDVQAQRNEGTYQAPEVKMIPDQRGIGRKSDIWSFGCIFSELLAFIVGRDKLVRQFQSRREGRDGDYFYSEKPDQVYLKAPDMPKQYEVHPSVLAWLRGLCGRQGWVDCYVETIKKILIVDPAKRPDAKKLTGLIDHVVHHSINPQLICPILTARDEAMIERKDVRSMISKSSSGTESSVSITFAKPSYAHGIMINSDVRRIPNESVQRLLSTPHGTKIKATAIALTHSTTGVRAAYLAQSFVYIYQLNIEEMSTSFEIAVPLPQPDGWEGIAIAGCFLAVWGYKSQRLLHLCDIREHQSPISPSCDIGLLERVAVSKQGVAALLCREKIQVVKLDAEAPNTPLSAQGDQKFTDVSFNDGGELLFAWAYGDISSLYVWRCQDGVVNERPDFESHYQIEKQAKPKPHLTRVVPYNTYPGCIISKPNKRLFAPQVRSSPSRLSQPQSFNYGVRISDAVAMSLFHDHSIIIVEKGYRKHSLKEYKIGYESDQHLLQGEGETICKLKVGQDYSSRLLVIKHNENIIAVVCNANADVEFVKFVPK